MVVLAKFGRHYTRYLQENNCNDQCRNHGSAVAWYFWGMVVALAFSHTLNVLIFKFKFKNRDDALRAAYFLPLIHLWRLVNLFWRTLSCKGVRDLKSDEMNGLFNILGTSFEGIPLLIMQFSAYLVVRDPRFIHSMSVAFKISVAASLLSAAYNCGSSVQAVAENARTLKQKLEVTLAAGLLTTFANLSRCLTYINIIVHMLAYFERYRSEKSRARFHATDTISIIFVVVGVTSYWLFYWLLQFPKAVSKRLHDPKKCLVSLGFGYISIILGPLYPMVSEAKDMGELGRSNFQRKLFMVAVLNLFVDISVVCVTNWMGTLPIPYLVTSSVAAVGYLVSLGLYIKIDRACGPVLVSRSPNTEEIEATQDLENLEESSTTGAVLDNPTVLDNASDGFSLHSQNAVGTNAHFENEENVELACRVEARPLFDIQTESGQDANDFHGCGWCSRRSSQRQDSIEIQGSDAILSPMEPRELVENEENVELCRVEARPLFDIQTESDQDANDFHGCGWCSRRSSRRQDSIEIQGLDAILSPMEPRELVENEENVELACRVEARPLFDIQTESDQDGNDFHGCGWCSRRSSQRQDSIEIQGSDANVLQMELREVENAVDPSIARCI